MRNASRWMADIAYPDRTRNRNDHLAHAAGRSDQVSAVYIPDDLGDLGIPLGIRADLADRMASKLGRQQRPWPVHRRRNQPGVRELF